LEDLWLTISGCFWRTSVALRRAGEESIFEDRGPRHGGEPFVSENSDKSLNQQTGGNDQADEQPPTGSSAEDALTHFAERAASTMRAVSGPLEILGGLIYLARQSVDDPEKRAEYLAQAEIVAQTVANAYEALLKHNPNRRR
jgi:hypothetical protein